MSERARFPLARRLRAAPGVPLGEVFTFLSGLYFRGKLAYARVFARPPTGVAGIHVMTPTSGILPADTLVTVSDLLRFGHVDIDEADSRYRRPLERSIRALVDSLPPTCEIVMLGSIATGRYLKVLLSLLGPRLLFPPDFVGRGDMSRGGLLLRCSREPRELSYAPVAGALLHGPRPPRLPRIRYTSRPQD